MSRDLAFWGEGARVAVPRGAIALAIGDDHVDGLEALDEARIIAAIDDRFPGWRGEEAHPWKFECDVQSTFITLVLHGGTPVEVEAWFAISPGARASRSSTTRRKRSRPRTSVPTDG